MNDDYDLEVLLKRVSKLEKAVLSLCFVVGALAAYILMQIFSV